MNLSHWYTDRMDILRTVQVREGALTRHERRIVQSGVPCRVYRPAARGPAMSQTGASVTGESKLACANGVDLQAGDELLVTRGGGIGQAGAAMRCFAGEPEHYYEPFGAVIPGLAHQEVTLLQEERIS